MSNSSATQTASFRDLSWGTTNPVMLKVGGQMVRVRAFGRYGFSISNRQLLAAAAGANEQDQQALADFASQWSRHLLLSKFTDALGSFASGKTEFAALVEGRPAMAETTQASCASGFAENGLVLEQFSIEVIERGDAPAAQERFYEMLWNCESCGAVGLFAKSQKHCPQCGSAQNPEKRYFPEEGQEVEVQGHQFVGADWHCPYCQSPNGAAASFCGACGGARDGSKEVKAVADPAVKAKAAEPPSPPPAAGGFPWFKLILVLLVLVAGFFIVRFLWKSDEIVKVVGLNWSREVDVERYVAVEESRWCNELPAGAKVVHRAMEEKGKKKVPDGETCKDVRIDKRDGTFTKKRECTPKYRETPEMAYKCRYRVNSWKVVRTDKAQSAQGAEPAWPAPRIYAAGGNNLGNERLASRREVLTVQLQPAKGEVLTCALKPEVWSSLKVGDTVKVKVRASGGADCDELKPRLSISLSAVA